MVACHVCESAAVLNAVLLEPLTIAHFFLTSLGEGPVNLAQPREAPHQVEIEGTVGDKLPRRNYRSEVQMQWTTTKDV